MIVLDFFAAMKKRDEKLKLEKERKDRNDDILFSFGVDVKKKKPKVLSEPLTQHNPRDKS